MMPPLFVWRRGRGLCQSWLSFIGILWGAGNRKRGRGKGEGDEREM